MRILLLNTRKTAYLNCLRSSAFSLEEVSSAAFLAVAAQLKDEHAIPLVVAVAEDEAVDWVQKLRKTGFKGPIIVHSEQSLSALTVGCLVAGADDVLSGEVNSDELCARLNAIVRRLHGRQSDSVRLGAMTFHLDGRDPEIRGNELSLSRREHEMLSYLVLNTGRFVSRSMIYEAIYALSSNPPFEKIIDVYICRLRSKLAQAGDMDVPMIEMVKGRGYRIVESRLAA